jgi:threonine dehydrogenase-like Zn-dependent dehydrogenase
MDMASFCSTGYELNLYALTEEDFAKKVRSLSGGGVNVCIEVTGLGIGLIQALDCMKQYGRVALLGCTRSSQFQIDYYAKVHGPGISLIGAHTNARPGYESHGGWWTQYDDVHAVMKLTNMGRLSLSSLVDEVHTPGEAPQIYTRLANEKCFPIVQFDWSGFDE